MSDTPTRLTAWEDSRCFGCSADNPHGLHLAIEEHGEGGALASFDPAEHHEGPPGHLHGGLAATALDEIMGWAAHDVIGDRSDAWVTASLDVRYRRPVSLADGPFRLEAETVKVSGRRKRMRARLLLGDDAPAVEAEAVFVRIDRPS